MHKSFVLVGTNIDVNVLKYLFVAYDCQSDSCFDNPVPLKALNSLPGGWFDVFLDLKFDCETCVNGWKFYATGEGEFFATVWRPSNGDSEITLIGKNLIMVESTGLQVSALGWGSGQEYNA